MRENVHAIPTSWLLPASMSRLQYFAGTNNSLLSRGRLKINPLYIVLTFIVFICLRWMTFFVIKGDSIHEVIPANRIPRKSQEKINQKYPLVRCPAGNSTQTCPAKNSPARFETQQEASGRVCPEYFRWIHEDLRPWRRTGITREMMERAIYESNFRLVILDGKVYVEKYKDAYQTRDVFTIWGILQLLRFYPGKLPDLDLVFHCGDLPLIQKSDYDGPEALTPPPIFDYCSDDSSVGIVFPDWSFWGWPEIQIKSWVPLKKELEEGNKKSKWMEREPYAYWKGNLLSGYGRLNLSFCNVTEDYDWNARIYHLDWQAAYYSGYKDTDLASQCTHRYKIYVEGVTWSVSEKYILACDSVTLLVTPKYYDFFTRSLVPLIHYWPINIRDECRSIQFAVDWGNRNPRKARKIGRAGSKFISEKLEMNNVYDYMFHLLNEYSKLLRYKPVVPLGAVELCTETMACTGTKDAEKMYKRESMVKAPADTGPCEMLPPYDPPALQAFLDKKEKLLKQVQRWKESGNIARKTS
ncbi:uncharacterized protein LOC131166649 [Malania oleifera]|uniref:uncharacterized protein LOC131166649 n=1 Tax=Malania oleifera TaxID=397392 RepID=UPI0025AE90E1|nr:uncharacterized protein LOC131166649 [Malania oleifera]